MPNKSDFFAANKEILARHLDIYFEGVNPKNVMIIKSLVSFEEAQRQVEAYIDSGIDSVSTLTKKQIAAIKEEKERMQISREYFNVIGYLHHISKIEFGYVYDYNGSPIRISPHVYGANMDINVCASTFDADYSTDLLHHHVELTHYEDVPEDVIIADIEEGFLIHTVGNEEAAYAKQRANRSFMARLEEKCKKEKQESLGKSKPITSVNIVDYDDTCTKMAFMVPFYVFRIDTGKEIITITYNAYSGKIGDPILYNPLASIKYAMPEGLLPPKFSIVIFIIASLVMIIFGGLIYLAYYYSQVLSYNKQAKKLTYEEQKQLL